MLLHGTERCQQQNFETWPGPSPWQSAFSSTGAILLPMERGTPLQWLPSPMGKRSSAVVNSCRWCLHWQTIQPTESLAWPLSSEVLHGKFFGEELTAAILWWKYHSGKLENRQRQTLWQKTCSGKLSVRKPTAAKRPPCWNSLKVRPTVEKPSSHPNEAWTLSGRKSPKTEVYFPAALWWVHSLAGRQAGRQMAVITMGWRSWRWSQEKQQQCGPARDPRRDSAA